MTDEDFAWVVRDRAYRNLVDEAKRARTAESAQVERIRVLEEVLRKRQDGGHGTECAVLTPESQGRFVGICNCGWEQARAALKEQP